MDNPFKILDQRLSNIESLLLDIKHNEPHLQSEPDEERIFSISELATYLKCTKATIHSYKNRGIFPFYQTGRTVFFKKGEIDAALAVNKKAGNVTQ